MAAAETSLGAALTSLRSKWRTLLMNVGMEVSSM